MATDPLDANVEKRVRASFARQRMMDTLGASLKRISPGEVEIALPYKEALLQQHGYFHGGAVAAIMDSACGYAALTVLEPGLAVLAVEFKVNFLAPAVGDQLVARGSVLKSGRTIIVCTGEAVAVKDGAEKVVATIQSTIMKIKDRGIVD